MAYWFNISESSAVGSLVPDKRDVKWLLLHQGKLRDCSVPSFVHSVCELDNSRKHLRMSTKHGQWMIL